MHTSLGVVMRIVIELSCWPDTKSRVFQQPARRARGGRGAMADRAQKSSAFELMPEVWGRRKWLAVAVFAVVFSAVGGLAAVLPNGYRSAATGLVGGHQVPEA